MSAPVTNTKVKLAFGQAKAKDPCRIYHMCVRSKDEEYVFIRDAQNVTNEFPPTI